MRLFLLGMGPLPCEKNILTQTAFGLRTWQFLSVLREWKGKCRLVLLTRREHYKDAPKLQKWEVLTLFGTSVEVLHLDKDARGFKKELKKAYDGFDPTLAVAVNPFASAVLAELEPKVPFWADLNGWVMAEAQSQAFIDQNDSYLSVWWEREKKVLEQADRISTVSEAQKLATLGELASLQRLNAKTEEETLVYTIPNANELPNIRKKTPVWRARLPEDAFIVFFSGAYNTWLDEETLFKGVEAAMKESTKLHFVSTGGAVANLANQVFERFQQRCKNSSFSDRFHFLGWLDSEELQESYDCVDLGINVDRDNNEACFGARNRINEWVHYELPVCSTVLTEVARGFNQVEGILAFEAGNPNDLKKTLLKAMTLDLNSFAKRAKAYAEKEWSYEKTTKPLLAWLKTPVFAKDKLYKPSSSLLGRLHFRIKRDGLGFLLKWLWKKLR